MRKARLLALLLVSSCATSRYAYSESDVCPAQMDDDQRASGVVRCRALCASYARNFSDYTNECRCVCAPAAGHGGYQPAPAHPWSDKT